MRSARPGFTLVELVIVLAIIAVLAALLFPATSRAKAKARLTQCASNLRQWGLAYRQYADDNEDYLPRRGQGVKSLDQINRPEDWFNALPPFLKIPTYEQLFTNHVRLTPGSQSVFICPLAIDPGSNHFLPYGMNMNLCPWGNSGQNEATKFSEVVQPAQVVAMADAPGPWSAVFPSANLYSPVARHGGRVDLLFLGGSVQAFASEYVGCGVGDPKREDVRWLTGKDSDAGAGKY